MNSLAEAEANKKAAQAAADKLPRHPRLGTWQACLCGWGGCRLVHPSNFGTYYTGTGFSHAEAKVMVKMFRSSWG